MFRVCLLAILVLGCSTSGTEVIMPDGTKIRAVKNSTLRKGPYYINVEIPVNDKETPAKITMTGNDEAMSGNLAMTGAAIGAMVGGVEGAAAGGIIGSFADWINGKDLKDIEIPEEITEEILGEELNTPPDL